MKERAAPGLIRAGGIIGACVLVGTALAQTNPIAGAAGPANGGGDDVDWSRHIVEAYQGYQLQQEQTFKMLQQAREEVAIANLNAQKAAQATEARLKLIEDSLAAQQQRDRTLENLQEAHRQSLLIVTAVAGVAFFSLLLFALYLMRVVNRQGARVGGALLEPAPARLALAAGDNVLAPMNPAEQATARFLAAIEQLEKRLGNLETSPDSGGNGEALTPQRHNDAGKQIALWVGKGQTLLNLGKPAEALECFDAALKLDAGNAETHVKRGTALEKLDRLDEAIDSFDRAIQLDRALTMAYLCKGGVYNRLERYSDALKCYEQALHSRETPPVP